MTSRQRALAVSVGLLALLLVGAGCGSGSGRPTITVSGNQAVATEPGQKVVRVPAKTTPTTTSSSATVTSLPYLARLKLQSDNGYMAIATLERGAVQRANNQRNGSLTLGATCPVDPERDAVEPFGLGITNTTSDFSASPGIEIVAETPYDQQTHLSGEIGYSDGPQCIDFVSSAAPEGSNGHDYMAFSPNAPLQPGAAIEATGFFILHDYYSPAHPQGNPAPFRKVVLTFQPQGGGDGFQVVSATGVKSSQAVQDAVPLIPGTSGGCLIHQPCPPAFQTGNSGP